MRDVQQTVDRYIELARDMIQWSRSSGDDWTSEPYMRANGHSVYFNIDRRADRPYYEVVVVEESSGWVVGYSYSPSLQEFASDFMEFSQDYRLIQGEWDWDEEMMGEVDVE